MLRLSLLAVILALAWISVSKGDDCVWTVQSTGSSWKCTESDVSLLPSGGSESDVSLPSGGSDTLPEPAVEPGGRSSIDEGFGDGDLIESNNDNESLPYIIITCSVVGIVIISVVIVGGVLYCRRSKASVPAESRGRNNEGNHNKITRKPGAWDEDYDYDDPDQQRTVNLGNGVFKEYLNDATYYLKFTRRPKSNKSQEENDDDYDDEDYDKDNGRE